MLTKQTMTEIWTFFDHHQIFMFSDRKVRLQALSSSESPSSKNFKSKFFIYIEIKKHKHSDYPTRCGMF